MSLNLPSRRLVRSATALTTSQSPLSSILTPVIQRRNLNFNPFPKWGFGKKNTDTPRTKPSNPLTEEFLKKKPQQEMVRGSLAESSIFHDGEAEGEPAEKKKEGAKVEPRNPHSMAAALDPDPAGRRRWERKMVIREITKRGRLSRTQLLKQQERVLISKSHNWATSVKKLSPLARQIAGKTLEDAIIQMRFSKKKAAKEVKAHLEHAKNEAIVRRGMGLGLKKGEVFKPTTIMTKDGKRVKVKDPTTIYVEQAWCGPAKFGTSPDHRARGNIYIMKNRTSHIAVVLREEKTRIRLDEERKQKEKNKKIWVQLPNRPITAQRQYYSW